MTEVGTTLAYGPIPIEKTFEGLHYKAHVYIFDCLSHTDGTLSGGPSKAIAGKLVQALIAPDSGDTAPTDAFDVTMPMTGSQYKDEVTTSYAYADILLGVGANVSSTTGALRSPINDDGVIPFLNGESFSVSASGCGSAKGFTVVLTVLP